MQDLIVYEIYGKQIISIFFFTYIFHVSFVSLINFQEEKVKIALYINTLLCFTCLYCPAGV